MNLPPRILKISRLKILKMRSWNFWNIPSNLTSAEKILKDDFGKNDGNNSGKIGFFLNAKIRFE